jgi:hypothetical protein
MRFVTITTAAVVVGMSGFMIGCSLKPASTPETTFESLQKAFGTDDFGATYDLLASGAQKEFSETVAKKAEEMKDMPPFARQLMGFDFTEVAKLPPRDAYIKTMGGLKESGKLGRALTGKASGEDNGLADTVVKECRIAGDEAKLTVDVAGTITIIDMVRENGVWKLANGVGPEL